MTYHSDPKIDGAMDRAIYHHPYYAQGLTRLRIIADENVPTMATSASWVTHYNPHFVAGCTVDEAAAVLVHELEHLLRDHSGRMGERDPKGWNIAGDAEINQRLAGLPDGAIYPKTLGMPDGRPAEIYYAAAGTGDDGDGKGGHGEAHCGSSAGGDTQAHEADDAANPGIGAAKGGDRAREDVAKDIIAQAPHPGTDAGDELRQWAETTLGIDRSAWYSALSTAVGRSLAPFGAPTRWQWPGRRDARDMGGAVLPRWTGEKPACAVVIDTSSSITPFDLDMARAAGHFIGRIADVKYYACDTVSYSLGSTMPEYLPGGGGTNLVRGIEMAIEDGARAVVVITDCMTPWPAAPIRNVPVIIGANPSAWEHVLRPGAMHSQYAPPAWMVVLPVQS